MKTSQAFHLTKAKLWRGRTPYAGRKSQFICIAAASALRNPKQVVRIIESLLGRHPTLEGWLGTQGYSERNYSIENVGVWLYNVQKTRHAWLDHLIEHYRSIGD